MEATPKGNAVAALASLIVPGFGQLTQGRMVPALSAAVINLVAWTVATLGVEFTTVEHPYWMVSICLIPGAHILAAMDAARARWCLDSQRFRVEAPSFRL